VAQTRGGPGQRVSVVINTYNRGPSLRHTLHALRYQTHDAFEVIVVNGPSTDDTEAVLTEFADDVRVAHCPEVHLSKSRNIGVAASAGEIVAFIDDDALPEPTWLEELVAAYDSDKVGGAGGFTYDHTGFLYQYRYSVCDRLGNTRFDVRPPFDAYTRAGADPFVYLQGTNASFRRRCLVEIGGFDEEIEYYMDEVDVCRRVIDLGYELRPLDGAPVHHKYLASHRRNNKKVVFEPFPNVKNHCYLAVLNNQGRRPLDELKAILRTFADGVAAVAHANHAAGKFTDAQRDYFLAQVERGLEIGIEKGLKNQRLHREFPPADPARFKPFGVLRPRGGRLKVCFISLEYPPGDFGGIGRFTADLATGFAALGHEVHVVTRSPDNNRVDFEDGVWLHRLAAPQRCVPELEQVSLGGNLFHSSGVYHEVRRIHDRRPLDLVSAPLWACEGLVCSLDRERFPTVLTLMTSMNTIAAMHPSWGGSESIKQVIALERETARAARYLHPISKAILEKVQGDYDATEGWAEVQPLGVRDRRAQYPRRREEDGKVRVLFVGRLERRKGVDVLLEAAVRLLGRFPQAEFVLAGKDTPNTETGTIYRAQFQERYGNDPAVAGRVTFTGAVSEDELYQHYADADVVCMPSRYESFGLVLVEGMVFGLPVIGCAVGGMCEIVEPDGNGLLARPGEVDSLEECLARLLGDEDLRCTFGARSRELYEERFALPLVVERTAQFYRAIAARHAASGRPVATEALARRLAGVLTGVTGLPAAAAGRAAAALLDPSCYPVDYLAAVRRLWHEPDETFLAGIYNLLLNRDPDHEGKAHYLAVLQSGAGRAAVVRSLALSSEAQQAGRPEGWLDMLEQGSWPPPTFPQRAWRLFKRAARAVLRRPGARAPRSLLGKVARKLRAAVSPRNLIRYAKRVVYLPWNFQKVYDNLPALHDLARQQAELQVQVHQSITQTLITFMREIQTRQDYLERRLEQGHQLLAAELRERACGIDRDVKQNHKEVYQELRQLKTRFADFYGALVTDQHEQTRLTSDVGRSLEEVRRLLDGDSPAQPRILNLDAYKARLRGMGETVRVHLGGRRADYINVDTRPGPNVDVVADAQDLPFAAGALAEIASTHLIDRFSEGHFTGVVLPYWKGLLRPGGSLRIVCPNWDALAERLCGGGIDTAEFLRAVSASVVMQGLPPVALYTPRALADLLRRHGFSHVEVIAEARDSGLCPEMEVVAHLPLAGQTALLTAG
jgi:glycosyltransferase involved in cell wall biosynthesis/GT2 family glycosyltransferase